MLPITSLPLLVLALVPGLPISSQEGTPLPVGGDTPVVQPGPAQPSPNPLPATPVLLRGATLHTMVPGSTPEVGDVLLKGRRIAAVGKDLEVPSDVQVIDLRGLHLTPGLIDGMANHDADHDALHLSKGITLLRDNGNERVRILQERLPAWRDRVPGPDLYIAGLIIEGNPPTTPHAVVIDDAVSAAAILPRLVEDAVDFFSVSATLSESAWHKTIFLAHDHKLKVWGALPQGVGLGKAIQARHDGVFGTSILLPPGRDWTNTSAAEVRQYVAAFATSRMAMTPMIHVYGRVLVDRGEDPDVLRYLGPHYRLTWATENQDLRKAITPELRKEIQAQVDAQEQILASLHAGGATLVPGSGAPNPWIVPGEGFLAELAHWVSAGIEPAEVLRLATSGAAEVLGIASERGSIAPGCIADLVAIGVDPRDSLAGFDDPEMVIVRGILMEREDLLDRLDALAATQAERMEAFNIPLEVGPLELPEGDLILSGVADKMAHGQRFAAERFAVVLEPDGTRSFCARLFTPGSANLGDTEVIYRQHFRGAKLQNFEIKLLSGNAVFEINGVLLGGLMNVQRKLNGVIQDTNRARQAISLVDVGGILTDLIIGANLQEGICYAVYFENLNPVEARWEVKISPDTHAFQLRTGEGLQVTAFGRDGVPVYSSRRSGNLETTWQLRDWTAHGGPGLALDMKRVFISAPSAVPGDDK